MTSKIVNENGYERESGPELVFRPNILREIVYASIEQFETLGTVDAAGNVFIDNDSKVLFVAHRDYVPREVFCAYDGNYIFSPQLDDRLGIYVALDLLPQCGIKPDILLTTDEEIGQSTASQFVPSKTYNWMFQFDRRGNDAVTYEYDGKKWLNALLSAGFKIGQGTFSDICFLDHLGICGVNVGTAYNNEHTNVCHATVTMLLDQVDTFHTFWKKYSGKRFDHTVTVKKHTVPYANKSWGWQDYAYVDYAYGKNKYFESDMYDVMDCEFCKREFKDIDSIASILEFGACPECFEKWSVDSTDGERQYCEVCGQFMPDGDYKSGVCFNCYEQMIK